MKQLVTLILVIALAAGVWLALSRGAGPDVVDGPRSVVVLDASDSAEHVMTVYEPKDNSKVPLDELHEIQFRWSSAPGAHRYNFVVNDEVGYKIWTQTLTDTVAVLPQKVQRAIVAGGRIKWIVVANGTSASTDIHRLELTR